MSELRKEMNLQRQRRNRAIEHLVKESIVNILAEQDLDLSAAPPTPTTAAPQQNQTPATEPAAPTPAPPDQSVPKQYTVDDMIRELNAIRSGRSFTDPEIYGRLVTFFKGLSEEQKASLDDLLSQIADLVTSVEETPGQQQTSPTGQAQTQPPPEAAQQSAPMPGAQPAAGGPAAGGVA